MAQRTKEERPSNPETAEVEASVEAMGTLFDGLEDASVPL